MKTIALTTVAWVLAAVTCHGQITGTKAGSAEAIQRFQDQKQSFAAGTGSVGELTVSNLKVGAVGRPERIDAKVIQVIDDNQVLVGVEDARAGGGRYGTWIMVRCPTAGITDGQFWRGGQWKEIAGGSYLRVTGTTTYKTTGGSTKTVLVVEPVEPKGSRATAAATKKEKRGVSAYDEFIDPVRELLAAQYEKEVAAVKKALEDDKGRLVSARTAADKAKYSSYIKKYTERLVDLEVNDPPYVELDALKKKK